MSNWQLVKELAKGVGIYKKQFFLFIAILFTGAFFFGIQSYSQYLSADPLESRSQDFSNANILTINLNIASDGRIFRDGNVVGNVELGDEYDIILYKILDKSGVYIERLVVNANYQFNIDRPDIVYEVKSAHTDNGLENPTKAEIINEHTIAYFGNYLGPDTTFTIKARFPKGVITPPWWRTGAFDLANLSIVSWIIIGLLLPAFTMIFLIIMLKRRWIFAKPSLEQMITAPPENLPPAILGVLIHGRIGPREIAATLIDLANRGYIYIFQTHNNFNFGRGHSLESDRILELNNYEKLLLSKIFDSSSATNNLKDINKNLGQDLFSQKMAQVFLEIYDQVSNQGYFAQNPGLTHQKYKIAGMSLFFLSIFGFIINALFNKTFPFLIFFWVGMMISATLIIYFSPKMPVLTLKGKAARQSWFNFRTYLMQTDTINFQESNQSPYAKYLPYSIALDVEVNWTKHFYDVPFSKPIWFDSDPSTQTIEDFANTLFPLVAYTSSNLISSRTPIVD